MLPPLPEPPPLAALSTKKSQMLLGPYSGSPQEEFRLPGALIQAPSVGERKCDLHCFCHMFVLVGSLALLIFWWGLKTHDSELMKWGSAWRKEYRDLQIFLIHGYFFLRGSTLLTC